jgi:LuxR family transcriptional regulator, positive regulator of biofilm formation
MTKQLIVIGKDSLNNSLLASYIEKYTTYPTSVIDFTKQPSINQEKFCSADLILIDCNSWDDEKIEALLYEFSSSLTKTESTHIALFNITEHCDTEHFAQHTIVKGLFPEDISHKQFITGIKSIFNGELWLSRKLLSKILMNSRKNPQSRIEDFGLTRRETEIIKLIADGSRNNDIADSLCLSEHTVKTHIYHIYKKLNVANRMQAANWVNQHLNIHY